jgi:hypothetical protein
MQVSERRGCCHFETPDETFLTLLRLERLYLAAPPRLPRVAVGLVVVKNLRGLQLTSEFCGTPYRTEVSFDTLSALLRATKVGYSCQRMRVTRL